MEATTVLVAIDYPDVTGQLATENTTVWLELISRT